MVQVPSSAKPAKCSSFSRSLRLQRLLQMDWKGRPMFLQSSLLRSFSVSASFSKMAGALRQLWISEIVVLIWFPSKWSSNWKLALLSGFLGRLGSLKRGWNLHPICCLSPHRTSRFGIPDVIPRVNIVVRDSGSNSPLVRFHYIVFGLPRSVHHVRIYASCALSPDCLLFCKHSCMVCTLSFYAGISLCAYILVRYFGLKWPHIPHSPPPRSTKTYTPCKGVGVFVKTKNKNQYQ